MSKVWIRPKSDATDADGNKKFKGDDLKPILRAPVDAREAIQQGDYELCEGDVKDVTDPDEVERISREARARRPKKPTAEDAQKLQIAALQREIAKLKGEPVPAAPGENSLSKINDGPQNVEPKLEVAEGEGGADAVAGEAEAPRRGPGRPPSNK